jgi:hypothetical protein
VKLSRTLATRFVAAPLEVEMRDLAMFAGEN